MRVYILGMDGYLGWPLRNTLLDQGHEVAGCDNFFRRRVARSLIPLARQIGAVDFIDVRNYRMLTIALQSFRPDVVVHFAELPSAPFSMAGPTESLATQQNNVVGSLAVLWAIREVCPEAHLLKLGTMGEYGPSSWYHISKVLDTQNCSYAAGLWGLKITDVMQGPVYGLGGLFNYDSVWGTVINRWVAMGVTGHDILVYGNGEQVRAFLPIQDSLKCFQIEMENPPEKGEHRVVNQFARKHSLNELAEIVAARCEVGVRYIENPRIEQDRFEAAVDNSWLVEHGYEPTIDTEDMVLELVERISPFKDEIDQSLFKPTVRWHDASVNPENRGAGGPSGRGDHGNDGRQPEQEQRSNGRSWVPPADSHGHLRGEGVSGR